MQLVETDLPSSTTAPRLARAFLREALLTWKLDGFGDITELLTSELVANVVQHVGRPMTLRVRHADDLVTVEVDDSGRDLPMLSELDVSAERGRGLLLVDALSDAWGVSPREDGKTVWFSLDVSTATAEAHEDG